MIHGRHAVRRLLTDLFHRPEAYSWDPVSFAARDVERCLACYVRDDDISYVGSEAGEIAHGRRAVRRLLTDLFRRPEAYSWDPTSHAVHPVGKVIHLTAEATGHATSDDGSHEDFPYRLTGLLQPTSSGWKWRVCVGAEPTTCHRKQGSEDLGRSRSQPPGPEQVMDVGVQA